MLLRQFCGGFDERSTPAAVNVCNMRGVGGGGSIYVATPVLDAPEREEGGLWKVQFG